MQAESPLIFPEWEFTVYYNENNGFKYALVKTNIKTNAKTNAGYKVIEASCDMKDMPMKQQMFPYDEAGYKDACDWLEEQRLILAAELPDASELLTTSELIGDSELLLITSELLSATEEESITLAVSDTALEELLPISSSAGRQELNNTAIDINSDINRANRFFIIYTHHLYLPYSTTYNR